MIRSLCLISVIVVWSSSTQAHPHTAFLRDAAPNQVNNEIIEQLKLVLPNEVAIEDGKSQCDLYSEASVIYCAGPLVKFLTVKQDMPPLPYPPLHMVKSSCKAFNDFKACVSDLNMACIKGVVGFTYYAHDLMCQTEVQTKLLAEEECLTSMYADEKLAKCQKELTVQRLLNSTVLAANETDGSLADGLTEQCITMQAYVDCLITEEYHDEKRKNCLNGVKNVYSIMNEIEPLCGLQLAIPELDPTRPECDENGVCSCELKGYALNADTNQCVDVNECLEQPARCSQQCINLDGSFECTCEEPQYYLSVDNVTCLRNDTEPLWIFFAHGQSIWNISEDGKDFQLQRAGLQKTAMIDLDMREKRLFYADIGANKIETMLLDGVFPKTIQFYEVEGTEGIAVDWIARNLYSLRKTDIWVQKLDGRFRMKLYSDVMKLPRALVVDPRKGYMYVTDWGSDAFIAKAALDGSSFEKIITDGIVWPNALAIDYYSDRLYWADAFLDTIEACNFDGSGRRTIVADPSSVPHVFGMAIADEYVYWTDWTYRGILRADKRTGANVTVLAQTALLPYSIKVYHPAMQPDAPNPCLEMGCSQLCLLSASNPANDTIVQAMCECAEGFALTADKRTCKSQCSDNQILCGGSDPRCISKVYWCDGQSQCWDHEDERDCPRRVCLPGQFQCHDNQKCLQASNICDGTPQCPDSSDETYC